MTFAQRPPCSCGHDRDRADHGFTLIELLIAIALSSLIVGVVTAALATSLNVARSTTDQVNDSSDAGLISSFLFRDAQSSGSTDPSTARADASLGVSVDDSPTGWAGCTQAAALVARFSWVDPVPSSRRTIVVTYALDTKQQLIRRLCTNGTIVDVIIGRHVSTAVATCQPGPTCATGVRAVTLAVAGTGLRAPFSYGLTAAVRGETEIAPDTTSSSRVALLALGNPAPACPNLTLTGTGIVTVVGDALVDGACGSAPIVGGATLRPTGTTSSIVGTVNPFLGLQPPMFTCPTVGTNPPVIGASISATTVNVYPQAVSLAADTSFAPGVFVFCNGLTMLSGRITGTGALFYVAAGTATISAGATIDVTAPTTGSYASVLFWIASTQGLAVNGGTQVSSLRGLIYAPTSTTRVSTSMALNIGGLVGKDVVFSGAGAARIGLPLPIVSLAPATIPRGEVGVAYAASITSTGGTAPVTWGATGLPAGLTIDKTTGAISGTPTAPGAFTVIVTSFDATALATSIQYAVSIATRLTLAAPAASSGQVAVGYIAPAGSAAGGTAPTTWSATGLPAGLAIDPATGSLSGTPTIAGTYAIVVTLTDALGATATNTIPLTIRDRLVAGAPTAPRGQVAVAYAGSIAASGGATPYSWTATGLPPGLAMSTSGLLTGTPTTAGAYPVAFIVTDSVGATAPASATITIDPVPVVPGCPSTITGWRGEYFANGTLTAPLTLCRDDAAINFDWSDSAPAPGLAADRFSARWTRTQVFAADTYTFSLGSDDGSRLYIDGLLVLDRWVDQGYPNPVPTVVRTLSAGAHTIVMEYYENGGAARATLTWVQGGPASCALSPAGWLGAYFANVSLSGLPTRCRDDAAVNFDWGFGAPIALVPSDTFSVRWTRSQMFTAGNYTFKLGTDDGGRLYVDGVLVIDRWVDQGYSTALPGTLVHLDAGVHSLIVEYYERSGVAAATLTWS